MEKLVYLICIILTCGCIKNDTCRIHILLDLTDKHFRHLSIDEIKKLSILKDNNCNGEVICISSVSEYSLNQSVIYNIEKIKNYAEYNSYNRGIEMNEYYHRIDSSLKYFKSEVKERSSSNIHKLIADNLNALAKSNENHKILIINSDLMENNSLNFYDPEVFKQLINDPDIIWNQLLQKYPIQNLNGIELILIYSPKDINDDRRFEVISRFYRLNLEKLGASVRISNNL